MLLKKFYKDACWHCREKLSTRWKAQIRRQRQPLSSTLSPVADIASQWQCFCSGAHIDPYHLGPLDSQQQWIEFQVRSERYLPSFLLDLFSIFNLLMRKREKHHFVVPFIHTFMNCSYSCSDQRWNYNLGIAGWHSTQMSYPARAPLRFKFAH